MATREEWVRHFEDVNGRKPSPEEFMEAKKESFVIASEEPSVQDKMTNRIPKTRIMIGKAILTKTLFLVTFGL